MSTPPYGDPPPSSGLPGSSAVNGTLILVLGILSIVCLPILGPVAWVMGNNSLPAASQDQQGLVNAGRICGIIGTVFLILGIIWAVFFGGLAAITAHHATSTPSSP